MFSREELFWRLKDSFGYLLPRQSYLLPYLQSGQAYQNKIFIALYPLNI